MPVSPQIHHRADIAQEPAPVTQVFFYPKHQQDAAQQDKDRYACYLWASEQTGFDPSAQRLAPHQRTVVTAMPAPGHDATVGAVTGAAIGAITSSSDDVAKGAAIGAITGAIIGAASDSARQQQAEYQHRQQQSRQAAITEQQADNYQRAIAACLEGRGYTVR